MASSASKALFAGLNEYSVVVYVERRDWSKIPSIVQRGFSSSEAGEYIPKTVIVNTSFDEIFHIVPYARGDEMQMLIEEAQNMLSVY